MDAKLKLGLSGLTPIELLAKGRLIVTNMTENASFSDPVPALADVQTAIDSFETLTEAAAFGDRRAVKRRRTGEKAFTILLTQLGSYVDFTAKGDAEVIRSSGFEVRKQPEPATQLDQPGGFSAKRSDMEGEVALNWRAVTYGKAYQIEMATSDPSVADAPWETVLVTSRSFGAVKNLTKGMTYWFRVMAISGDLTSAYSGVEMVMAA